MKKIGVLGTGAVGNAIATKLVQLGYEVKMGSRTQGNEKAVAWVKTVGSNGSNGTFEDAAKFGEIVFLCTKGEVTLKILELAGIQNFKGKTVIDISNPLDFSHGMPPSLLISNTDSLGEHVQNTLKESNVVKTLNIVNCQVMVDPSLSGGEPTMFICGNDKSSKAQVEAILGQFGWKDIIDLGDITSARGTEMMLPVWLRAWMATGDGHIAFKIVLKAK